MTGEENVKRAFDGIRAAATMLETAERLMGLSFREAAQSLRRQEDVAWFTNPTMMKDPLVNADLQRKLRLLDAAGAFLAEHAAVRHEVSGEQPPQAEPQADGGLGLASGGADAEERS